MEQLFDVNKMTDRDRGDFEFIVNSPSYLRVFRPYLTKMQHSVQTMMLDRSTARKETYPDDFLAGQAAALIGFVAFLDGLKNNTNMERMNKSVQLTTEEMYADLRNRGAISHSGQHISAEDLEMSEDY